MFYCEESLYFFPSRFHLPDDPTFTFWLSQDHQGRSGDVKHWLYVSHLAIGDVLAVDLEELLGEGLFLLGGG